MCKLHFLGYRIYLHFSCFFWCHHVFERPWPLPLSNSERQQRWGVKTIANEGKALLSRKCDRVKSYYKKVADMTEKEKEKEKAAFRRKTIEIVRRHRKKIRELKLKVAAERQDEQNDDANTVILISEEDEHYDDDDDDDDDDDPQERHGMSACELDILLFLQLLLPTVLLLLLFHFVCKKFT